MKHPYQYRANDADVQALARRIAVPWVLSITVTDPRFTFVAENGKAFFRVPSVIDGYRLTAVAAHLITPGTGTTTVQVRNVTDLVDMLFTSLTIDSGEKDSITASVAAVVWLGHDGVATADELRIDVAGVAVGSKGLIVELQFSA